MALLEQLSADGQGYFSLRCEPRNARPEKWEVRFGRFAKDNSWYKEAHGNDLIVLLSGLESELQKMFGKEGKP